MEQSPSSEANGLLAQDFSCLIGRIGLLLHS